MKYQSRRQRLDDALEKVGIAREEALAEIELLYEELETWQGNLEGTNLENTQKYQDLEEALEGLQDVKDALEGLDYDHDIMFPSMF